MATVLTINGSTVTRATARITISGVTVSMDGPGRLEFTENAVAAGRGTFSQGQTISLSVDGTVYFSGRIARATPVGIGRGRIDVSYLAIDLRWLASQIPITNSAGSGVLIYNLPSTDPDYVAGQAGKSVGDIIKALLDLHSTQLSAIGITGYTLSELTALTVVPPEPVVISGKLWPAIENLLAQWCNKYAIWISASDGLVHIANTFTGLSAQTLTLDTDPIILDSIGQDHSECFTQVVVRGGADIQGVYLRLSDSTIEYGWTGTQQTNWTLSDFTMPKDAADTGSITSMTSTTITVTSDDATKTWATNYWATQMAYVWAYNPAASGINFWEERAVTACGSMSAGGSCTITVDTAFANSGYTKYAIRGNKTGMSTVWRRFEIPDTYINQHLQPRFSHSVPFNTGSAAVANTWVPTAVVCWSASGTPPYLEFPVSLQVVPYDGTTPGYILFDQPVVNVFNSRDDLEAGGASVTEPDDLIVLLPVSRGALTVQAPTSGYEGTAYTVDGLQRTLTVDYPDWLDSRNSTSMATLAQEILDTVKDTVVEGQITYLGKAASYLTLGKSLNIARAGGTTGWESLGAPIREVSLEWPQAGASIWVTRIRFSTRRRPFNGDRLYTRPSFGPGGFGGTIGPIQMQTGGMTGFDSPVPSANGGIAAVDTVTGLSQKGVRSGPKSDVHRFTGPPKHLAENAPENQPRPVGPPKPKDTVAGPPRGARGSGDGMDAGNVVDDHDRVMRGQTDVRDPNQVAKAEQANRINRDQSENARRLARRQDRKKAIQSEDITDLRPIDDSDKLAGN